MKIKFYDIELTVVFLIMLFWDVLNSIVNRLPLILILVILILRTCIYRRFKINKAYLAFLAIAFIHGTINVSLSNNTMQDLIAQIFSIAVCLLEFSCVVEHYGVEKIFKTYWLFALIMAVIAIIQEVLNIIGLGSMANYPVIGALAANDGQVIGPLVRARGVCSEPSFLGYFLMPAVCLSLYDLICQYKLPESMRYQFKKAQSIIILIATVCSFSLVAYVGLLISIVFVIWSYKKFSVKRFLLPFIAVVLIIVVYNAVPPIQMRIDDTLAVFTESDINSVNLSSASYRSNFEVMKLSVVDTFGIGSGLGSCKYMFDRYNLGGWGGQQLRLNREDANSMLFRLLIELGIWGVVVIIAYFIRYLLKKNDRYYALQMAILSLVIILMLRQGNYTHGGVLLFFVLYKECYNKNAITIVGCP